jgi:hypothetical protein
MKAAMDFNSFSPAPGALTEISGSPGSGKTELILKFLSANPALRVAWIEEKFSVYPCAFPLNGVELGRVFFVDVSKAGDSKAVLWAAHQVLQSQVFAVVILSVRLAERESMIALRRLQLAAEKNRGTVILLGETPTCGASWPISLQLQVSRSAGSGEPVIRVIKNKGRVAWQHQIA